MQSLKKKPWLLLLKNSAIIVLFLKNFQNLFKNASELMNLKISNVWKKYNKHVQHRIHIFECNGNLKPSVRHVHLQLPLTIKEKLHVTDLEPIKLLGVYIDENLNFSGT